MGGDTKQPPPPQVFEGSPGSPPQTEPPRGAGDPPGKEGSGCGTGDKGEQHWRRARGRPPLEGSWGGLGSASF